MLILISLLTNELAVLAFLDLVGNDPRAILEYAKSVAVVGASRDAENRAARYLWL